MPPITIDVAKRALRTFVAAFLAIVPATTLMGYAVGSQPVDTSALRGAGVAGVAAVISFLWAWLLDPSPIPSLKGE